MKRVSIAGMLIVVVLFAIISAIFARLHEEAFFYVTGPILGAMVGAFAYRRDRSALITGGAVGGLCQGIFAIMVLRRGHIVPDNGMMTGAHFLANLAVHLMAGLVFGTLLYLAFRWARPRSLARDP